MKKIILFAALVIICLTSMAQTNKIMYQAVVRDDNNRLITNKDVTVDITITYGSETYTETGLTTTTNANGLLSLTIGNNTGFKNIDWSNATVSATVNVDGKNIISTTAITALPFALQADYADDLNPAGATMQAINHLIDSLAQLNDRRIDSLKEQIASAGSFVCGTSKARDYEGNLYKTVKLGTQCWTAENIRSTKYSNGENITYASNPLDESNTDPLRYLPFAEADSVPIYGYLYNWPAVMHGAAANDNTPSEVQGICPTGWHVPSYSEWQQLITFVNSKSEYQCNGDDTYAKALASKTVWITSSDDCAIGNMPENNNSTGFSMQPASFHSQFVVSPGYDAFFWSTTENNATECPAISFGNSFSKQILSPTNYKRFGMSVRCIRNM